MKGIDAATNLSPHAHTLADAGIGFAGRYYSYNKGKDLSASEAAALAGYGLRIVSVWEAQGDRYASFHAPSGQAHGHTARLIAEECGQPPGTCIYFAVDFDATIDEIAHGIMPYFQAAAAELHGRYTVGAYGSGLVLSRLHAAGLASYLWLAQSQGWQGTKGFTGAHIVQGPVDKKLLRVPVDTDESTSGDCGSWLHGETGPSVVVETAPAIAPTLPSDKDIIANIAALQQQLKARGYYGGKIDGIAGPHTVAALNDFERQG